MTTVLEDREAILAGVELDAHEAVEGVYAYLSVTVPCPVPVNFYQDGPGTDVGSGTLHFVYRWDSSTGNKSDLQACSIYERVDYNPNDIPFPSPPFQALSPQNPSFKGPFAANIEGITDDHTTPGGFVAPYREATVNASQMEYYTCPCANGGNPVTIFEGLAIVRAVTSNGNGTWRFVITKNGSSATVNPLP